METKFLTQPDNFLGKDIINLLETKTKPKNIIFVSAFVSYQTIYRLKEIILNLKEQDVVINFVLGIDLDGTSKEVLNELLSWNIDVKIFKHPIPGYTFHPKLYIFEWENEAEIIIGSNNLTDGGLFKNYECYTRTVFNLPIDNSHFLESKKSLKKFIEPDDDNAKKLDAELIKVLSNRNDIPDDNKSRSSNDNKIPKENSNKSKPQSPFTNYSTPSTPPLPPELLKKLTLKAKAKRQLKNNSKPNNTTKKTVDIKSEDLLSIADIGVASFYMTLHKLQGKNIPGEARVPLNALEIALDFWGWPTEYSKEVSPRKGKNKGDDRVYWNWKPVWTFKDVDVKDSQTESEVRMYMYENSSDFRFYLRPLVIAGADTGDIVKITRVAQKTVEFECELAKKTSPEYKLWIKFCTQKVTNSDRFFGYS